MVTDVELAVSKDGKGDAEGDTTGVEVDSAAPETLTVADCSSTLQTQRLTSRK